MRVLRDLRRLVVADGRVERGDEHQRAAEVLVDARVVRLDDDGAIARPLADPSSISFAMVEQPYEPAAIAEEAGSAADTQ